MAVIPLRKDQPPPPEPLRKLTVRIDGHREWGVGVSYQMIASDGSVELIGDRKSIHIADGRSLGRMATSACGGSIAVATAGRRTLTRAARGRSIGFGWTSPWASGRSR